MARGDVPLASGQGLVPFVAAATRGLPLKLVGVAVSDAATDNCVARCGSGITDANAAALQGKKIATLVGSVTHQKPLRMLDHLGVGASKVEFVQMNAPSPRLR